MSKRREARMARIASARTIVAEVARLRRIEQTQAEVNALADSYVSDPDTPDVLTALMATERGRELAVRNRGESLPPITLPIRQPTASRTSALQEAILETLADGLLNSTGGIIARLGMAPPTKAQRGAVSRALTRLNRKGLVDAYKRKDRRLTGDGRLWRLAPLAEPDGPNLAKTSISQPTKPQQPESAPASLPQA